MARGLAAGNSALNHEACPRRKAYSYLRFSAPEQIKGDSFRRQMALAVEYAEKHNLELDDCLTFHDLGVSAFHGRNAEAGQLGALLDAVKTGMIASGSVVLVESLDRISRQAARRALHLIESIVDAGVAVITLNDGREYTTDSLDNDPFSLLMALLTFIRANEESSTKSHRIAASWVVKRQRALERPLTARCPGWVRLSADRQGFVLVPEQADLVRSIFSLALAGYGSLAISRHLNSINATRLIGGPKIAKMWYSASVSKLLRNVATIGTLLPYKMSQEKGVTFRIPLEPIYHYFPPVIAQKDFEQVQQLRGQVKAKFAQQGALPVYNIIGRLAFCASCGSSMMLVSKSARGHYLVCRQAYAGVGCAFRSVRYREVETVILRSLPSLIPSCRFPTTQAVQRQVDTIFRLCTTSKIDRPALNVSLRSLIHSIKLYPDEGRMVLLWKHGYRIEFEYAFTSAADRENDGLLRRGQSIGILRSGRSPVIQLAPSL